MHDNEMIKLVQQYLDAYNSLDVDGMLAFIHPDIEFRNITGSEVDVTASGKDEFLQLAEQSRDVFTTRNQAMTATHVEGDKVLVEVSFTGVLAMDLPNGLHAGDELSLDGRSEYTLRGGLIYRLDDIS